jgi:integrase
MLFRLVRPVKRTGSRHRYFVRRIPSDVKSNAVGVKLAIPVGEQTQTVVIRPRAQSVRLSLRTDDPAEVKVRLAAVDAYLENVWRGLRNDAPIFLTHKQATALAGEFYRAWANGDDRERTNTIEHDPEFRFPDDHIRRKGPTGKIEVTAWRRASVAHVGPEEWEGVLAHWDQIGTTENPSDLEKPLGAIVDRLLLAKGIRRVTSGTRDIILLAFWQAGRDAFESRKRNAEGDYSPDAKSERFPEWSPSRTRKPAAPPAATVSLKGIVKAWWIEAKATGRKPSTHESYANTMAAFVGYLGHDDAGRVTRHDVIGFKDHRLASVNPRTGTRISAKTVKDSDLAALKTIFGWAKANGKMDANPAEGVTIKLGKPRKVRSKGFTDTEADAVLNAALSLSRGQEKPKTFAAKHWVPWLCAYSGARVGELAQLRKEDIRHEGAHWVLTITPEAGTVKTNEARDVVLHPHLVELGFTAFVKGASPGHLFLTPSSSGDVSGPLQGVKNRIAEFVRTVVPDKNVAPNHGWRHRFKTVGIEAGIEHRILDAIQGHRPRNVAEGYGEVTIKTQAAAIAKLPRYKVSL